MTNERTQEINRAINNLNAVNLYIFITSLVFLIVGLLVLFFGKWLPWVSGQCNFAVYIPVMLNLRLNDRSTKKISWSMTLFDRRNDVKMLKTHARPAG